MALCPLGHTVDGAIEAGQRERAQSLVATHIDGRHVVVSQDMEMRKAAGLPVAAAVDGDVVVGLEHVVASGDVDAQMSVGHAGAVEAAVADDDPVSELRQLRPDKRRGPQHDGHGTAERHRHVRAAMATRLGETRDHGFLLLRGGHSTPP